MSALDSLRWKLRRLRSMGVAEIAYRVKQHVEGRLEQAGIGLAHARPPVGAAGAPWCKGLARAFDAAPYLAAADDIIAGRFDVFAMKRAPLGFPPQWNRDCRTGTIAPLVFGKRLNYRDECIVGDIKYLWEPNRHLELVTLAQAYHLSGEQLYADGARRLLASWFEQCPYPLGPNWTSSLEHSVRLVNWAFAWHLLGGNDASIFRGAAGQAFKARWMVSVFQHCHFIAGHFSLHSSANNHLLGEYMGLFVGCITWPLWPESGRWKLLAQQGLEREALLQNCSDGVNREQATWYHHEVADMMLLCGVLGRANGAEFSAAFWQRLEAMLEFVAAIMDRGGVVPMIGDSDDAVMVRFSREQDFDVYRSLLAAGALLFSRADFKRKAGKFDDKVRWLFGDEAEQRFDALQAAGPEQPRRAFPEGGYYVLGKDFGLSSEVRIVADCAPLGYLSIAAHGHADALAFTLSAGGQELLIDPGTYAYHTQKKWRDYFRSTAAHNTACVDGLDQSVIGGNFMWLRQAQTRLDLWHSDAQCDRLRAGHDGYARLEQPLMHERELVFDKMAGTLRVIDTFRGKGRHSVALHWHCHEAAQVAISDGAARVVRENAALAISMPRAGFALRVARGEENEEVQPLGWISRSFDDKSPTSVLVWSGEVGENTGAQNKTTEADTYSVETILQILPDATGGKVAAATGAEFVHEFESHQHF